ncbi:hypothetical protein BJY54_006948 [Streptomyces nodosus]|nr:hypothetical protein [Streptomyces nodosus]MBB4796244.1 hypothetical protein [Streptomyces nodosus]
MRETDHFRSEVNLGRSEIAPWTLTPAHEDEAVRRIKDRLPEQAP